MTLNTTSFTVSLPFGKYQWFLSAGNIPDPSEGRIFYVTPLSGIPKAILKPVTGDNIVNAAENGSVNLEWENAAFSYGAQFQNIEISRSRSFPSSDKIILMLNTETTTPLFALSEGRYYWRVRTFLGIEVLSSVGTFVIDLTPPTIPIVTSPTTITPWTELLVNTVTPRLLWASSGATRYELRVVNATYTTTAPSVTIPSTQALSIGWSAVELIAYDLAGNSSVSNFVVGVSLGNSPLNSAVYRLAPNANTVKVRFTWSAIPNTTNYVIAIDSWDGLAYSNTFTTNATTLDIPLPQGLYTYRIYPSDLADTSGLIARSFAVAPSTGLALPTLNPTSGDNRINAMEINTDSLSWNAPVLSAGSTGISYDLQIARNNTFTSGLQTLDVLDTYISPLTLPIALTDGTYYWRVRANYETATPFGILTISTAYSPAASFVLDRVAPSAPLLYAPTNNALVLTQTPYISWYPASGATRYRVEITDVNTVQIVTQVSLTNRLTISSVNALSDGLYEWVVYTIDAAGNESVASLTRRFRVDAP